ELEALHADDPAQRIEPAEELLGDVGADHDDVGAVLHFLAREDAALLDLDVADPEPVLGYALGVHIPRAAGAVIHADAVLALVGDDRARAVLEEVAHREVVVLAQPGPAAQIPALLDG